MAFFNSNGVVLTSLFSTSSPLSNPSTSNYNQNSSDIDNLLENVYDGDTAVLNDAYRHFQNTNYKVGGVDIKMKYLPFYYERSIPNYIFPTAYGTIFVPTWANYARCIIIGAGGGAGGGEYSADGSSTYYAGSSGGGGAYVDFTLNFNNPNPPNTSSGPTITIVTTTSVVREVYYVVGVGGNGGSRGNPSAGDGQDGAASKFKYGVATTTRTYTDGTLTNESTSTVYTEIISNGGGKGYGGNGYTGTQNSVGGVKTGTSTLSKNGNDGSLGGSTGIPQDGGYNGIWANYDYRGLITQGRGGRGGIGAVYSNTSTAGSSGNDGYIRIYFLR